MFTDTPVPDLSHLPPEMLDFTLSKTFGALAPRLGRLTLPGRKPLLTPDFLGNTSRGAVPHISQDNYRSRANLGGVYVALEDFVEKHPQKIPPVLQYEVPEPLRRFIALTDDALLIMGARRMPPLPTPMSNTNSEVALQTSVGFKAVSSEYYAAAARKLQPDIVVGLADIPFGQESVSTKRKDKMSDRTESWMRDIVAKRRGIDKGERKFNIFAPFLPLDKNMQNWYMEHLVDEMADQISGIAVYDAYLLDDLPEELHNLPRLSLHPPASPQEILRQTSLGMDIFTIPFVNEATDAGIALDFTFPAPQHSNTTTARHSLGIDMWQPDHATSLIPLSTETSCSCYACSHHHRAYIQHLLNAKEMLGWVLLQLHNHAILTSFFAGIRASISASTFPADVAAFEAYYEPQLPEKSGQGPRVRGYHFSSQAHAKGEKKNPKAYSKDLEGKVKTVKVFAAHGQEPQAKPETRDLIDDEALEGIVDLENLGLEAGNGNGKGELELELEDDENGQASSSS